MWSNHGLCYDLMASGTWERRHDVERTIPNTLSKDCEGYVFCVHGMVNVSSTPVGPAKAPIAYSAMPHIAQVVENWLCALKCIPGASSNAGLADTNETKIAWQIEQDRPDANRQKMEHEGKADAKRKRLFPVEIHRRMF